MDDPTIEWVLGSFLSIGEQRLVKDYIKKLEDKIKPDKVICDKGGVLLPSDLRIGGKVYYVSFDCDENGEEKYFLETGRLESVSCEKVRSHFTPWGYCIYNSGLTFQHILTKDYKKVLFGKKSDALAMLNKMNSELKRRK